MAEEEHRERVVYILYKTSHRRANLVRVPQRILSIAKRETEEKMTQFRGASKPTNFSRGSVNAEIDWYFFTAYWSVVLLIMGVIIRFFTPELLIIGQISFAMGLFFLLFLVIKGTINFVGGKSP